MVFLGVLGLLAAPGVGWGDHGEVHGYCVDGVPVVTYWPEKYAGKEFYEPGCLGGNLVVYQTEAVAGVDVVDRVPPADFGGWATVWLNGDRVVNPYRDVYPYVVLSSSRTLIPIRMVTEAMGGTADWDGVAGRVTIRLGERYMEMTIGSAEAIANGGPVTLDQPPIIWKDRTMVPLRVLAEAFGATVTWVPESFRVYVTLHGVTCRSDYCMRLWE